MVADISGADNGSFYAILGAHILGAFCATFILPKTYSDGSFQLYKSIFLIYSEEDQCDYFIVDGVQVSAETDVYEGEHTYYHLNGLQEYGEEILQVTEQTKITLGMGTATANTTSNSALSAYQAIIDEYAEACAVDDDTYLDNSYWELFDDVSLLAMTKYHIYGDSAFYYAYYDINHDGQDELLIEYLDSFVDVYTYDGSNASKLFDIDTLGERTELTITTDGTMIIYGSSGAQTGFYELYKIAEDGYSLVLMESYTQDGWTYPDTPYYNENGFLTEDEMFAIIDQYTEVTSFSWNIIYE